MKTKSRICELLVALVFGYALLVPALATCLLLGLPEDAISLSVLVVGIVVILFEESVMRWLSGRTRIPPPYRSGKQGA